MRETTIITADQLATFRRSVHRAGGVIVVSSPIGSDRYAVTVEYREVVAR